MKVHIPEGKRGKPTGRADIDDGVHDDGADRQEEVQLIVLRMTDRQENGGRIHQFHQDGPNRDIPEVLQSLVEPFDQHRREQQGARPDDEEVPVGLETVDDEEGTQIDGHDDGGHDADEGHQAGKHPGPAFPVFPAGGNLADADRGDSHQREKGEIPDGIVHESHLAHHVHAQDPGHVREQDQVDQVGR